MSILALVFNFVLVVKSWYLISHTARLFPVVKVQNYRWGNATFRFGPLTMVMCTLWAINRRWRNSIPLHPITLWPLVIPLWTDTIRTGSGQQVS